MYHSLKPATFLTLVFLSFTQAAIRAENAGDLKPVDQTPAGTVTVHPALDNTMLLNPGKGYAQYWEPDVKIFYKYREPDDKYVKDYIGIGYSRFNWSALEPKEGVFDWNIPDRFIAEYARYGKKVGFGVMSVTTGQREQYVTPKWVFDAGAASATTADESTPTGTQIIPKSWDDPVFLAKLHDFIKAFGARYNGNPNIAFMDVRDYGNWGECDGRFLKDAGVDNTSLEHFKSNYLLPYIQAFPNTQLIVAWTGSWFDGKPADPAYDWAVSKGVGIRRDGILSQWTKDGSECLRSHGHVPAVFEYCDTYENTKKAGYWSTELLWKSVLTGKPSYMHWDRQIFEENKEFMLKLGNKIGYHFVLQEAEFPAAIKPRVPFQLKLKWFNDGVTYLYEPCSVAVALLDSNDRVVDRQWLEGNNPKSWAPDESKKETLSVKFSAFPPGIYKLAIGLFLDRKDAAPAYKLGIQGRTSGGWYLLSDKVECAALK